MTNVLKSYHLFCIFLLFVGRLSPTSSKTDINKLCVIVFLQSLSHFLAAYENVKLFRRQHNENIFWQISVLWILLVSLLTRSLVWRCLLRRRLLELTALFVLPLYVLGSDRAPLCRGKLSRRCLRLRFMLLLPSNCRKSWVHFRVINSPGEVLLKLG